MADEEFFWVEGSLGWSGRNWRWERLCGLPSAPARVETPKTVHAMDVDWEAAA